MRPRAKLSCSIATSAIRRSISVGDFATRRQANVLVGEIDLDLEMCANCYDLSAQFLDARGKGAGKLRERIGQCRIATRGDDVGDGLGLGEIDAPVQKCTAGEFARLCQARARGEGERHDAAHHEGSAVALDLGDIFAGQAGWMGHRDRQRAVDVRAGRGIDDVAEAHRARCALGGMRGAEESVEDFEGARAGEADDRDGADAGSGGGGDDRVGGVHGGT